MPKYLLKRDSYDERDHLFARPAPKFDLPAGIDLRQGCSPIVDQGELGSCTANAIASGLREFMELKAGQSLTRLSRLFLYYKEREMEGTVSEDSGASIRDGMKVLLNTGVCPEIDWPYDITRFAVAPPEPAEKDAAQYLIKAYQRLVTLTDIKRSLYEGYPVVVGITVFESLESKEVAQTGQVPMPKDGERVLGGHAVLIVGYEDALDNGRVVVRNSWGEGWGEKGYCYIPYKFMEKYAFDFWTAR